MAEVLWDELFKRNAAGRSKCSAPWSGAAAFENALRDLGLDDPGEDPDAAGAPRPDDDPDQFAASADRGAAEGVADDPVRPDDASVAGERAGSAGRIVGRSRVRYDAGGG